MLTKDIGDDCPWCLGKSAELWAPEAWCDGCGHEDCPAPKKLTPEAKEAFRIMRDLLVPPDPDPEEPEHGSECQCDDCREAWEANN